MNLRFECGVIASLLTSGASLTTAGNCSAVIGAVGVLLGHSATAHAIFVVPVLFWPVACYFSVRVSIDASLFRELALADQDKGAALDELFRRRGFARERSEQTITDRSQGAMKLWKRLIAITGIQVAASVAAMIVEVLAR